MANIPGAINVLPGVYDQVITQSSAANVPGGLRVMAVIGTGLRQEVIVTAAVGNGDDGLNPAYTSTTGSDGRHFSLVFSPIISGRTQLFKNGILLQGAEIVPSSNPFSESYDYIVDITTGHIELQSAYIVNQGGAFYTAGANNVGDGYIANLQLVDINAPNETWTIKCISTQRNSMNQPIAGTALFTAFGSVSGNVLDANGNPTTWLSDGVTVSNTILSFAIYNVSGETAFAPGDYFSVKVYSGVLNKNDSLTANYIAVGDINAPTFYTDLKSLCQQCGPVALDNTLSLGAYLAFSNATPGVMAVEAAPPLPRRISYQLETNFPATSTNVNDFVIPLPFNITPDPDSAIHIFVTNPVTNVETQLLPNQFPYYTLGTVGQPTVSTFVFDNANPPSGNSFSYSLIQSNETLNFGQDGVIGATSITNVATFSSASFVFNNTYVGDYLTVIDSANNANIGTFVITGVSDGELSVTTTATSPGTGLFAAFVAESSVSFQLYNPATASVIAFAGDGVVGGISSDTATFVSTVVPLSGYTPVADGYQLQIVSPSTAANLGTFAITADTGTATTTTVALLSNGAALPVGTINVLSTASFPSSGTIVIVSSAGPQIVSYTGKTSTTFTTCTGGTGTLATGGLVTVQGTLTISKTFVSETGLKFEVIDPAATSEYLVLNHNVVPNNNSLRVTVVNTMDANFFDAGWLNALASLETQEIDVLVPLPQQTITVIFDNCLNHCLTMSNILNKKERVLFIGAINGLQPDNVTGAELTAVENIGILEGIQGNSVAEILAGNDEDLANYSVPDAYGGTYRVVYFYPDQIVATVGTSNQIIDGFYIAAAAAGYLCGQSNVAMPLTNKILSGFTIPVSEMFAPSVLMQLAGAGVCTLQPVAGGGVVLWGLTTTQSGFPEEQEISIVFIRDHIAKTLRTGFAGFIGLPEAPDEVAVLTTRAVALLNSFISGGLITAFQGLQVAQDAVDPRQWDITVLVQPVYPVNWIYIQVGVGVVGATS